MTELSTLNDLSAVLEYPTTERVQLFDTYAPRLAPLTLEKKQELYTRTFDINGPCCLDVGFVLFGEDYKRGDFLVGLKDLYRRIDYHTGTELPDYLPYLLEALTKMPKGTEQDDLAEKILIPALSKMIEGLNGTDEEQALYKVPLEVTRNVLQNNFIIGQRGII